MWTQDWQIHITYEHVRNAHSWALPQTFESETVGLRPSGAGGLEGDSDAHC